MYMLSNRADRKKGKLARASASRYAPSHGSWEVRVRDPAYADPPAPAGRGSEVTANNETEARLFGSNKIV